MRLRIAALILANLCFWTLPAAAQEPAATRAEALRRQREAKAREVKPYEPNGLERAMHFAEGRALFLIDREGLYPKLGSLTTGSGFAYGMGFRDRDLFAHRGALDIWAASSIRRYWAAEARLTFPELAGKRLFAETWASHRDYPQEDFFGVGPDSVREDRSNFALRTNHAGGRAGVRPVPVLLAGGGFEYLTPRVGRGTDRRMPSLEDRFGPLVAPGLGAHSNFLRSLAFVEVDYREPRNARKGGWYRLDFSHYQDRDTGRFTFNRLDLDLRQFVGFLAERRVLAARLFVSTSDVAPGREIPFYFMPTLGGHDTLRGFREYRFRGPHAILLQGEYRWEIWSGLDGALFYDAGKVANRRQDLDFADLERNYGIGFRFNTSNGVILRVDAGLGSRDGRRLYIVFGGVF